MARTKAELTKGARITDYISLGVIGKVFPMEKVKEVLDQTGKTSKRQRDLPGTCLYNISRRGVPLCLFLRAGFPPVAARWAVILHRLQQMAPCRIWGASAPLFLPRNPLPRNRGFRPRPYLRGCRYLSLHREPHPTRRAGACLTSSELPHHRWYSHKLRTLRDFR